MFGHLSPRFLPDISHVYHNSFANDIDLGRGLGSKFDLGKRLASFMRLISGIQGGIIRGGTCEGNVLDRIQTLLLLLLLQLYQLHR